MTPWLPQTPHSIARTLEERGIERRRIYTSMYLPVEAERGHGSPEVAEVTAAEAARIIQERLSIYVSEQS